MIYVSIESIEDNPGFIGRFASVLCNARLSNDRPKIGLDAALPSTMATATGDKASEINTRGANGFLQNIGADCRPTPAKPLSPGRAC
jgi:hypothetical protein